MSVSYTQTPTDFKQEQLIYNLRLTSLLQVSTMTLTIYLVYYNFSIDYRLFSVYHNFNITSVFSAMSLQ